MTPAAVDVRRGGGTLTLSGRNLAASDLACVLDGGAATAAAVLRNATRAVCALPTLPAGLTIPVQLRRGAGAAALASPFARGLAFTTYDGGAPTVLRRLAPPTLPLAGGRSLLLFAENLAPLRPLRCRFGSARSTEWGVAAEWDDEEATVAATLVQSGVVRCVVPARSGGARVDAV